MLAEMVLDVDASALLVYRAAWLRDVKGRRNSREAALAKLHATDSAQSVIDKAVQIFGGLGVTQRRAGRAPLPRDQGAADLRRRLGGAEGGDRPRPSGGDSAMKALLPPGWPRPRGYANGISAKGRIVFTAGIIGWDEQERIVAPDLAGQFRQILLNTLAILAEDGAGPEHVVRMTWYVVDIDEYRAASPRSAPPTASDGPQLPGDGGGGGGRPGRARGPDRDRDDGGGARMMRHASSATGCRRRRRSPNSCSTCPSSNIPSGSTPRSS